MLAALLLLGILPLAALPFGEGDEADDDIDPANQSAAVATTSTTLFEIAAGDPGETDPEDDGLTHQIDATPGETVIEGFEAGVDLVELDLTSVEGDLFFDMSQSANGATVSFSVGEETTTTLVFDGLTEVPAGDIMLRVLDEDTGEEIGISLADAALLAEQEIFQVAAIDPVDPELPDGPGPVVDPTTVTDPVDPETPDPPGPIVTPGEILEPLDPNAEVIGAGAELALNELLERDSENLVGMGETLAVASADGVNDIGLSEADDTFALADDGLVGTGEGHVDLHEAAPVVHSVNGVDVVDGGAGDDEITTGDGAVYVFGGEGADSLTAGDGAAALFGGADDDVLNATTTAAYLDGGSGDDQITGGTGDDILEGGEHGDVLSAGDDTIDGGAGDDTIRGGYGADQLSGDVGDDVIDHLGRTEQREVVEQHEFDWHIDGASDSLSGGEGDDTLIFDRMDTASGGAGSDLFWLYHDGADTGDVAEITDFVVGEDFLRVSLNPNIGENGEPDVLVEPSGDGADGLVMVNGDLVAILRGAPTATASDIYAEVKADVFA